MRYDLVEKPEAIVVRQTTTSPDPIYKRAGRWIHDIFKGARSRRPLRHGVSVLLFANRKSRIKRVRINNRGSPVMADMANMTSDDWRDAARIVARLARDAFAGKPNRNLFFSKENGWVPPWENFRACWSEDERVAVFYGVGLAEQFAEWALQQPEAASRLLHFQGKIVVVIPCIVKMNPELLRFLENHRQKLWGNL